MPRSTSPLAPALLSAADRGTSEVISILTRRRHKPVRGTHLRHAPGPSSDLDAASLLLRAATYFSEAHDVEGEDAEAADSYREEARGYVRQACAMLGLTEAGDAR